MLVVLIYRTLKSHTFSSAAQFPNTNSIRIDLGPETNGGNNPLRGFELVTSGFELLVNGITIDINQTSVSSKRRRKYDFSQTQYRLDHVLTLIFTSDQLTNRKI